MATNMKLFTSWSAQFGSWSGQWLLVTWIYCGFLHFLGKFEGSPQLDRDYCISNPFQFIIHQSRYKLCCICTISNSDYKMNYKDGMFFNLCTCVCVFVCVCVYMYTHTLTCINLHAKSKYEYNFTLPIH
jgi:hypothetical protein